MVPNTRVYMIFLSQNPELVAKSLGNVWENGLLLYFTTEYTQKWPGLLPGFPGSLVCQDQIKSRQGPGTQLASSPTVTKFPALSRKKTGQDWDFTQECVFIEEFVRKKDEPSVKRGDVASKQQGGMRPGWLPRSQCFQHDRLPSWQHWTRHTTASSSHPPSSPLLSVPQPWVPHSQVPMAF